MGVSEAVLVDTGVVGGGVLEGVPKGFKVLSGDFKEDPKRR